MWMVLQTLAGLVMIAVMVAVQGAALYLILWVVLIAFRRVPLIGRKHRHADWHRLNKH